MLFQGLPQHNPRPSECIPPKQGGPAQLQAELREVQISTQYYNPHHLLYAADSACEI